MSKTKKTPKKASIRGGSWDYSLRGAQVANRGIFTLGDSDNDIGVRLVEVLHETSNADRET